MKLLSLVVAAGMLAMAGCSERETPSNGIQAELDEIRAAIQPLEKNARENAELGEELAALDARLRELAAENARIVAKLENVSPPVRVAVVDRSALTRATSEWTQRRIQEEDAKEVLTEEQRRALAHYQGLQQNLNRLMGDIMRDQMEASRPGPGGDRARAGMPINPRSDPSYIAMAETVEQAREPVADILDRRAQRNQALQYPIEGLIREYIGERFDVVLDQRAFDQPFHQNIIRPEVVNITHGVIELFVRKTSSQPESFPRSK